MEGAVRALAGVEAATVGLVPGGTSTLTVSGPASPEDIHSAVEGAGYAVTGN
ncbi:heavy-metal-associated domain-containing protein [Arthrobacter sp. A2-55]|nr:heavy-metal-associated domain-containing protein [Arthrobacter sp. A2-55]